MDSIVIPWSDNSGDNIYLSLSGDSVEVTSDANWTGEERSKMLTFATTVGVATAGLTVTQGVGVDGVVITHNHTIITEGGIIITE